MNSLNYVLRQICNRFWQTEMPTTETGRLISDCFIQLFNGIDRLAVRHTRQYIVSARHCRQARRCSDRIKVFPQGPLGIHNEIIGVLFACIGMEKEPSIKWKHVRYVTYNVIRINEWQQRER